MNSDPTHSSRDLPVYDVETDTCYSIEVIAELAGVDPQTILYYQEQGFIRSIASDGANDAFFDVECLRQLRRINHLRTTCEMNDAGLKLMLDLLNELECLREEQRQILR